MDKEKIVLGISPCPNDTFMFYGLIRNKISHPFEIEVIIRDVEALNEMVMDGMLTVSKVSYHLALLVREKYKVLRAGGALGWGCGPIVVTRQDYELSSLRGKVVITPGKLTTAALLLRLYEPQISQEAPMLFSKIPMAVKEGKADAGVIIHESRFTFSGLGLKEFIDLGRWWEMSYGLPVPLGGPVIKRQCDKYVQDALEQAIRDSIDYAWNNMEEVIGFSRHWARELDEDVLMRHIKLYVNEYSYDIGQQGQEALDTLFSLGVQKGLFDEDNLMD